MPAGDYLIAWDDIIQLWYKARKRAWPFSADFPLGTTIGDEGTITSAADLTEITDDTKTWNNDQWIGSGVVAGPVMWKVVIDLAGGNSNPREIISTPIVGNDTDTLDLGSGLDVWVARGHITSTSDLVGKKYWIISNTADSGRWWSERVPEWPRASSRILSTPSASSTTTLTDASQVWANDQWNGYDLIYQDAGGVYFRATITDTTNNQLVFATQPGAPSTAHNYHIIDAAALWHEWKSAVMMCWYRNPLDIEDTHLPDHTIGGTVFPTMTISIDGNPVDVFDKDLKRDFNDATDPDRLYTPNGRKTIRGLQAWLEDTAQSYVEIKSYDGYDKQIRNMTVTEWARASNLHFEITTLGVENGGGIECPSSMLKSPPSVDVWFAKINSVTGVVEAQGRGLWANGILIGSPFTNADTGEEIQISAVWTRHFPRRFRYVYDKTAWRANDTIGQYELRPKSTRYSEYDRTGHKASPFSPENDGADPFDTDDLARYIGDNHGDPTYLGEGNIYDTFYTGVLADRSILAGTITAVGNDSLTDDTKTWTAIRHTESGTASGGSTTTLTDSSQSGSEYWTQPSWGRWLNHVVEIDEGGGVWHKRIVSSHSGTTVGWDEALPFSASGKAYRFREPQYELHRWNNRKVKITGNGNEYFYSVAFSDDKTLWFDTEPNPSLEVGWTYEIDDLVVGHTYMWNDNEWQVPAGSDHRKDISFPEKNRLAVLPPDTMTRYGRYMKGDYFTRFLLEEINYAISQLMWTLVDYEWFAKLDELVYAESQSNGATGVGSTYPSTVISGLRDDIDDIWPPPDDNNSNATSFSFNGDGNAGVPPEGQATQGYHYIFDGDGVFQPGGSSFGGHKHQIQEWGRGSVDNSRITCVVELFNYSGIDDSDSDVGDTTITNGDGDKIRTVRSFDSFGADVLYRQWSSWDETTPDVNGDFESTIPLGVMTLPDWGTIAEPTDDVDDINEDDLVFSDSSVLNGYAVLEWIAIAKWNM